MMLETHTYLLKEIDNVYHGMRDYKIADKVILKTEIYVKKSIILWRDLKLSVIRSVHLFENLIICQTSKCYITDEP